MMCDTCTLSNFLPGISLDTGIDSMIMSVVELVERMHPVRAIHCKKFWVLSLQKWVHFTLPVCHSKGVTHQRSEFTPKMSGVHSFRNHS